MVKNIAARLEILMLLMLGLVLIPHAHANVGTLSEALQSDAPSIVLEFPPAPTPTPAPRHDNQGNPPMELKLEFPDQINNNNGNQIHEAEKYRENRNDHRDNRNDYRKSNKKQHRDNRDTRKTRENKANQERRDDTRREPAHQGPALQDNFIVTGIKITDNRSGRVLPIDKMDLKPALERIARGEKNPHRNDGSVYRNLNRKLPRNPTGYYHEYVVPTPGLYGPGPQRLIIGNKGEVYYTWDHYDNFIKIK